MNDVEFESRPESEFHSPKFITKLQTKMTIRNKNGDAVCVWAAAANALPMRLLYFQLDVFSYTKLLIATKSS